MVNCCLISTLKWGDGFFFNVYIKATGPNPIEVIDAARWVYVEPDYSPQTQKNMIADFKARLSKERKTFRQGESSTWMPGDGRFFSAYAVDAENKHRTITTEDLSRLQAGTELPFVIVEITYKDQGAIHHARQCAFLQPPADPPGIWHYCEGFNKSD